MTLERAITVIEIGIVHFVRNSPSKSLQPSPWAPLLRCYRPAERKDEHMNLSQIKKHAIALVFFVVCQLYKRVSRCC